MIYSKQYVKGEVFKSLLFTYSNQKNEYIVIVKGVIV